MRTNDAQVLLASLQNGVHWAFGSEDLGDFQCLLGCPFYALDPRLSEYPFLCKLELGKGGPESAGPTESFLDWNRPLMLTLLPAFLETVGWYRPNNVPQQSVMSFRSQ